MNRIAQAVISAAFVLPLTLPAQASPFSPSAVSVRSASSAHVASTATGPKDAFLKLHAQRSPRTENTFAATATAASAGHFDFPYGVATDASGDLLVTNVDANDVVKVNAALQVLPRTISVGLQLPISVAVDGSGNIFVGDFTGGVNEYTSAGGAPIRSIAANTAAPFGIAVDQFDDLFVPTSSGFAVDDPYGASLFSTVYGGTIFSVALAGANVWAYYNNGAAIGNGSVLVRSGQLQYVIAPLSSQAPVGSACSGAQCWYDDSIQDTLFTVVSGNIGSAPLPYSPAGVAVDTLHNRLFVADPKHNAIQIYNATTLAFERTLT